MCLAAAAPIFGLAGSVLQGVGAGRAAQQEAANQKSMQSVQERQAGIIQTTGAYKAQRKQEEVQRVLGQNRAAFASSGVALSGSALDTITDNATEGALDVAAIRWNSGMEADTQRTNATISGRNAANADAAAPLAFITPVIGGVARYASSFGS